MGSSPPLFLAQTARVFMSISDRFKPEATDLLLFSRKRELKNTTYVGLVDV